MSKHLILNVRKDFDFNSLKLTRDTVTNEFVFSTAPIIEIFELSGIDPKMKFTDAQISIILTKLYQFHLSQGKKPIQAMEKMISDIELEKHFNEFDIIQSPTLKH